MDNNSKNSVNHAISIDEALKTAQKVKELLYHRYKDKTLYAHVHSYGCQQNVSDGEKIMGLLCYMGYTFIDTPQNADIVIYNTCAVRENAEDRVYGNIGELSHVKAANPAMLIGLCGCMVQQEHIAQKIKKSYPQVDMVFGTHAIYSLPKLMLARLNGGQRQQNITMDDEILPENAPVVRDKSTAKANLPIMYGCNNFCTYCVVPYVRGREKSRKSDDIIAEFKGLIKDGFKEVTLLGQNVNSYGNGMENECDFSELLEKLNALNGDFRIRFMSSHPKDATFKLIDTIASCEKVAKHFHLPVQSGSDRILNLMNRHYNIDSYMKLIKYARKKIPDIAFTSDIIVGFPGETYDDFSQTIELIKAVEFDSIFSFIYSRREGTKAALINDIATDEEKISRFQELIAAQKIIGRAKYQTQVGKKYRVLVEGYSKLSQGFLTGRNEGYMIIDFKGDNNLIGTFVNVLITRSLGWALEGEIL